MKLLTFVGALILSAAPVQAFEKFGELNKTRNASEENFDLCDGTGDFVGAAAWVSLLCTLEAKGRITKENSVLTLDEFDGGKPLTNEAVEIILKDYPECSIKP